MEQVHVFNGAVTCAVSDKTDGNMSFLYGKRDEVVLNRERFLGQCGIMPEACVVLRPTHGDTILRVGRNERGGIRDEEDVLEGEALMTDEHDTFLFLLTADCFPIVYYDPRRSAIALAHAGWRPVDLQLSASVAVQMKKAFDSSPADIEVYMGPGIRKESYIVEEPSQKNDPKWRPYLLSAGETNYAVDLPNFITNQLLDAGITQAHITMSNVDTYRSQNQFSHYRAKRSGELEGRFATVVGLR
jgi:hypothetical protein